MLNMQQCLVLALVLEVTLTLLCNLSWQLFHKGAKEMVQVGLDRFSLLKATGFSGPKLLH